MTLPRPARADLANGTDVYIRMLAEAIDPRLGAAVAVATLVDTYTTDADGVIRPLFPTLGQIAGALVIPCSPQTYANGAITSMPPVPPASIGRVIPQTPVSLSLLAVNVGYVQLRAYTTPWDNGVYQGQAQQMSAQNAVGGVAVRVVGIAWGAKA
jgi:hypothetical protein